MKPRALITGVTGQDGWYLRELLEGKGYEVRCKYKSEFTGFVKAYTIMTTNIIKLKRANCKIIKNKYPRPIIIVIAMHQYKKCRKPDRSCMSWRHSYVRGRPEQHVPVLQMQGLEILPELTKRIRDTVTADHGNKSVLIVGDASSAYRYFLALSLIHI